MLCKKTQSIKRNLLSPSCIRLKHLIGRCIERASVIRFLILRYCPFYPQDVVFSVALIYGSCSTSFYLDHVLLSLRSFVRSSIRDTERLFRLRSTLATFVALLSCLSLCSFPSRSSYCSRASHVRDRLTLASLLLVRRMFATL